MSRFFKEFVAFARDFVRVKWARFWLILAALTFAANLYPRTRQLAPLTFVGLYMIWASLAYMNAKMRIIKALKDDVIALNAENRKQFEAFKKFVRENPGGQIAEIKSEDKWKN